MNDIAPHFPDYDVLAKRNTPSWNAQTREVVDRRLAILSFHKIGEPSVRDWDTWFYIPESTFVSQLCTLHDSGWDVIDLAAFNERLARKSKG